VGRKIYWKKSEIEALEAALLRFEGRCAFDRRRKHERAVKAATRARPATRDQGPRGIQQDLFS
jgi:hypothetical protein